jgi:hypothetical protein
MWPCPKLSWQAQNRGGFVLIQPQWHAINMLQLAVLTGLYWEHGKEELHAEHDCQAGLDQAVQS